MYHFCLFEMNMESQTHEFVCDFKDNYEEADEFCSSMNHFRASDMPVIYCVRCLDQDEFEDVENYSPFIGSIVISVR